MSKHLLLRKLGRTANIISVALLIASVVMNFVPVQSVGATPGGSGSIWTTNGCSGGSQDVNHYSIGDHVYINGSGFSHYHTYNWDITGQPGSGDPNQTVASGTKYLGSHGSFCFDAYTVAGDDSGEYKATFDNKHDNYRVDAPEPAPALSLAKSANPSTYSAVSDVIGYTYVVTNSGNVALDGPVTVSDDKVSVSCPSGGLAISASMTCTASHTITQGDLDAGSITNHATASASYNNQSVNSNQDTATVTANTSRGISLTKVADPTTYSYGGQVISYTYTITNNGNVTLAGPFSVSDDKTSVSCPAGGLAPGASLQCTATYSITSGDLDAVSVVNTATASGNGLTSDEATATVLANVLKQISLSKSADPSTYDTVGQQITYSYTITNSGNGSLAGPFSVSDNKASVTCPAGGLAHHGSTLSCTASYTITQDDLDNGSVTNTATASGNNLTSNEATATVYAVPESGILLTKAADPATFDTVGQAISYTYTIKNVGNVTLAGPFSVSDDKTSVSCPAGGLAPGASLDCTASYLITQDDLDAGAVTNTATASGNDLKSNEAYATVDAVQNPALTIVKTADPTTYTAVDDVISYSYLVTNTGNITVSNLGVVDDKATVSCPVSSLAPTETTTCTASYTIIADDLTAGSVTNTAYAEGWYGNEQSVQTEETTATVVRFIPLSLAALCAANPTANNGWQITNANPYEVDYEVTNADGSYSEPGGSPIPANSAVNIETSVSVGGFLKLYSGGVFQASASAATGCIKTTTTTTNPQPPVVVLGNAVQVQPPAPAIGGPTVLIPVTGLDLGSFRKTLPSNLFSLSLVFFGLGLVMTGISRKKEKKA